jgi:hypothetical protein
MSAEENNLVPPPDDPIPGEVTHTPIIITDGSASLEFTEGSYIQDPDTNVNTANDNLHLVSMTSAREHTTGQGDRTCFNFQAGQVYEIEVKCVGPLGGFNNFEVRGSLDPQPPPEIEFDRGEYRRDPQVFPPVHPQTGRRFGSLNRRVQKVRIFRLVNGQRVNPPEHDCPLVSTPGNSWTIHDDHVTHVHDDTEEHTGVVEEGELVQPV